MSYNNMNKYIFRKNETVFSQYIKANSNLNNKIALKDSGKFCFM